jgi:hypothetical protein
MQVDPIRRVVPVVEKNFIKDMIGGNEGMTDRINNKTAK